MGFGIDDHPINSNVDHGFFRAEREMGRHHFSIRVVLLRECVCVRVGHKKGIIEGEKEERRERERERVSTVAAVGRYGDGGGREGGDACVLNGRMGL